MKLRGGRWTEIQRSVRENEEGRRMRGRETVVCSLFVWEMELIHMGLHLLTITTLIRLLCAMQVSWEVVPLIPKIKEYKKAFGAGTYYWEKRQICRV